MTFLILAGTALVVVVIALWATGHAVHTTAAMPDQIVVDVHEAIEFCAQALADEHTAQLSYDDLRGLLRLHLEWIQAYHWSPSSKDATPIVFEQFDAVNYMMERITVTGVEATEAQVAAVVQAHSDYLQVMGAIHVEDPVDVEADLAEFPLLGGSETAGQLSDPDGYQTSETEDDEREYTDEGNDEDEDDELADQ